MFNFRNFVRTILESDINYKLLILHKSTKCKASVSNKPIRMKTFNTENKYLFGSLIETQKQRRKSISNKNNNEENVTTYSGSGQLMNQCSSDNVTNLTVKETKPRKSKKVKKNRESNTEIVNKTNDDSCNQNLEKLIKTEGTKIIDGETNINDLGITSNTLTDLCVENLRKSKVQIAGYSELEATKLSDFPLENPERSTLVDSISDIKRIPLDDQNVKNKFSNYPSVSKIINTTMSDISLAALKRWRMKMISELGEEGFQAYYKGQLNRGSEFHETIRKKLMGEMVGDNSDAVAASLCSLQWLWPSISSTVAVETHIAHPQLCYRGIIDCVAKFKDTPVVIEWKLSDKPKPQLRDTYDAPLQLSAYVGAFNYDSNFTFQINHGLVVVAYSNGSPADAFFLAPKHCQAYWKIWLDRLNKFNNLGHLHVEHDIPKL